MSDKAKILFFDYWTGIDYEYACGAGLGSSLFKLTALVDAHENNFEVHLLTSTSKVELLGDAYGIDFIYSEEKNIHFEKFSKVINLGIHEEQIPDGLTGLKSYHPFNNSERKAYKNSAHIWFWRNYVAKALSFDMSPYEANAELCLESESLIEAAKLMSGEFQWIAISSQSISKLKDYPYWNEVIDSLLKINDKIRIVLLGHQEGDKIDNTAVVDLRGKTNIQLLKAVISRSALMIGVDGLATNISQALETPTTILFTMISPENVLFKGKANVSALVSKGCPYQFCYKDLINYRNDTCRYLKENSESNFPLCLNFNTEKIVEEGIKLL